MYDLLQAVVVVSKGEREEIYNEHVDFFEFLFPVDSIGK